MSSFRPGWYEVQFDPKTYRKRCRYFKTISFYVADGYLEPDGSQRLVWQDPAGLTGPGRPQQWSAGFRPLPTATLENWWEAPPGGQHYQPENPGAYSRANRKPSARELAMRAAHCKPGTVACEKEINVGIFFDGTNNNMYEDRNSSGHSNVVSLFDAHKRDAVLNFRYYIPGVGTPFPEIGEVVPDDKGASMAKMGEARINFGMLQVFNAACRAVTGVDLLSPEEMKFLSTDIGPDGLATWWRLSDIRMVRVIGNLNRRLLGLVENKRPRVTKLHLSVFGFSRGAAQARAFANWIQLATGGKVGTAILNFKFLGIFDTVASVGIADSSNFGNGLMDWADSTMRISGPAKAVHFVAAHEIRRSFPLSTARDGSTYPAGVKEFVYPGAHSDIGGGYSPRDQGKSMNGRASLLSQIALKDMYFEAVNAGAALHAIEELPAQIQADYRVDPQLDKAFSSYETWTRYNEKEDVAQRPLANAENRMQYHTQLYWRWRASASADQAFKSLNSYKNASDQHKVDLWESELDWRADVQRAQEAATKQKGTTVRSAPESAVLHKQILAQVAQAGSVPAEVHKFFDDYVHDSHGGFWMLGPLKKYDREKMIQEIKQRKKLHDEWIRKAEAYERQLNQPNARLLPDAARALAMAAFLARREADSYKLNRFEQRVFETDKNSPGNLPVITDADVADLRENAGTVPSAIVRFDIGTGTRREPFGHGRYRRVFDVS